MSSHRAKKMSISKHQREAHKFMTSAGYKWVKTDSHEHNHYHHHADRAAGMNHIIVTVSSPYSDSEALKQVREQIKRHDREREAHMAARAGGQIVSNAQIYANMADAFLLKDPGSNRTAMNARSSAFVAWVKRVLEKHGPVLSAEFEEAANLIGFAAPTLRQARLDIGAVSYRASKQQGISRWMAALPHQVPDEYRARKSNHDRPEIGVDPVASDPNTEVTSPPLVAATERLETISIGVPTVHSNGTPPGDTQAAALLLLESLGIKQPGAEARAALMEAKDALTQAGMAVDAALKALS